jgi:hypothetical protein
MDNEISVSSFILGIGFAYIFIFLYLWYILTIWMVFLKPIHTFFANSLIEILVGCDKINWSIKIQKFSDLLLILFYSFSYFSYFLIERKRKKEIKNLISFELKK